VATDAIEEPGRHRGEVAALDEIREQVAEAEIDFRR